MADPYEQCAAGPAGQEQCVGIWWGDTDCCRHLGRVEVCTSVICGHTGRVCVLKCAQLCDILRVRVSAERWDTF